MPGLYDALSRLEPPQIRSPLSRIRYARGRQARHGVILTDPHSALSSPIRVERYREGIAGTSVEGGQPSRTKPAMSGIAFLDLFCVLVLFNFGRPLEGIKIPDRQSRLPKALFPERPRRTLDPEMMRYPNLFPIVLLIVMVSGWCIVVFPFEQFWQSAVQYPAISLFAVVGAVLAYPKHYAVEYRNGPTAVFVGFLLLLVYSVVSFVMLVF